MTAPFIPLRRWITKIIVGSLFALLSSLGAQDIEGEREAANRQLYLLMYNTAMSDSVISEDERAQLETLQQALGINIDLVEEMLASPTLTLAPKLDQSGRWTLMLQNMIWGSTLRRRHTGGAGAERLQVVCWRLYVRAWWWVDRHLELHQRSSFSRGTLAAATGRRICWPPIRLRTVPESGL